MLAGLRRGRYSAVTLLTAISAAAAAGLLLPVWLHAGDDLDRNALWTSVAVATVAAVLVGLFVHKIMRDHRRIAESEQRFRRAMEDSAIGVAIVGLDGAIVETNPAFAAMLGYTRPELETLSLFDITHPDDLHSSSATMADVRHGKIDTYRFEKRYMRADGTAVWTLLSGSVIRDAASGQPLYLVSQIEDIDARKQAQARIAEAETRWNFALASAGQGVWDFDIRKGGITYSATWMRMLGYDDGELDGDPNLWLSLIHPDDRDAVEAADRAHLDGRTPHFEAEFRMRRKDGNWLWILDRGKVIERAEDGRLIRAIGSLTDITARKEAEDRLKVSAVLLADEKERLRVTLQSIGDAVICTDADNRITFMNPVAEKLTGQACDTTLGLPLDHAYRAVDEETGQLLDPRFPSHADHNNRAVLVRHDGTRCSIRQVVSPILNERGEPGGSVIVFQEFTDARALQRQLAHAASHDALTGLANRSSFIRRMEELVRSSRQDGAEHQFMFIDLDHFKTVNDTGGHAAGDALLKRVAQVLRAALGHNGIVARLGGDEFAAILIAADAAAAKDVAEAIIAAIRALDFRWNGQSHAIGASIGLAPIGAGSGEADEIIVRADVACYAAKAAGRGCAFTAEPAPEPVVAKTPQRQVRDTLAG